MVRLFLTWAVLTALLFGVRYFMDQLQRKEAALWGKRITWCGVVTALVLALVVFLERL